MKLRFFKKVAEIFTSLFCSLLFFCTFNFSTFTNISFKRLKNESTYIWKIWNKSRKRLNNIKYNGDKILFESCSSKKRKEKKEKKKKEKKNTFTINNILKHYRFALNRIQKEVAFIENNLRQLFFPYTSCTDIFLHKHFFKLLQSTFKRNLKDF